MSSSSSHCTTLLLFKQRFQIQCLQQNFRKLELILNRQNLCRVPCYRKPGKKSSHSEICEFRKSVYPNQEDFKNSLIIVKFWKHILKYSSCINFPAVTVQRNRRFLQLKSLVYLKRVSRGSRQSTWEQKTPRVSPFKIWRHGRQPVNTAILQHESSKHLYRKADIYTNPWYSHFLPFEHLMLWQLTFPSPVQLSLFRFYTQVLEAQHNHIHWTQMIKQQQLQWPHTFWNHSSQDHLCLNSRET